MPCGGHRPYETDEPLLRRWPVRGRGTVVGPTRNGKPARGLPNTNVGIRGLRSADPRRREPTLLLPGLPRAFQCVVPVPGKPKRFCAVPTHLSRLRSQKRPRIPTNQQVATSSSCPTLRLTHGQASTRFCKPFWSVTRTDPRTRASAVSKRAKDRWAVCQNRLWLEHPYCSCVNRGTGAGVRTLKPLRAADFKSAAYASSATPARCLG